MGYILDAEGTRVSKGTITAWSCDPAVNGFTATSDMVLGLGGEQVAEMAPVPVNGTTTMAPQHLNAWSQGKLLGTYDGDGDEVGNNLHFYIDDWLGTRRAQTDAYGVLEETCFCLPYGDGETCAPTPTEHLFTGKERDSESGNDYFGARYYGSVTGRFLSPDPGNAGADPANPQSWDMYSYSLNSPLTLTDPTGLYTCADSAKCDSANDKAFAGALASARTAANRLSGNDKTAALRALDAYGDATKDNGVRVGFSNKVAGGLTQVSGVANGNKSALNPNGQNIHVTFNPGFSKDAYGGADLVSHEGSHVADGSAWVASGFSANFDPTYHQGDIDANHVQFNIMNSINDFNTPSGRSWAGVSLYGGSVRWNQGDTFKSITPALGNAIRKSYAAIGVDDSKPSLQKGAVLPQ